MGIHTLHLEHVVLLALYTLLTVANSWLYKGMKGIHWFSLYNLFALLGALSVALRGEIPAFVSIVLGNLFVMIGYLLLFLSLAELFGHKRKQLYLQIGLVVAGVAGMMQYGLVHPDTKNRLIVYSIVLGLQQALIAVFISRKEDGTLRVAGSPMALMVAALAMTNLVRMVGVLSMGAPKNYLDAGPFLGWILIVTSCLQCGAMVAYVWMTAALLRHDLERQAATDPLTGVLNRRALDRAATRMMDGSKHAQAQIAAITVDLDRFKEINDTYGHSSGDAMLTAVAECLQLGLRTNDCLARLGGDEFLILLPRTSKATALEIAERLRLAVERLEIPCGEVMTRVTASFGLVHAVAPLESWQELVTYCDLALYAAKKEGGNRVMQPRVAA